MLELTGETGALLKSVGEARPLAAARRRRRAARARRRSRGRRRSSRSRRPLPEGHRADQDKRVAGGADQGPPRRFRSVRASDPQGKLGKPNEFGYDAPSSAEVTDQHPARRAGFILPAKTDAREPGRGHAAAPTPSPNSNQLGPPLSEVALDGGSTSARPTRARQPPPDRVFIAGRQQPAPDAPRRRTALPHRRRGPDQPPQTRLRPGPVSRLKGDHGHQIWTGWTALTYNADTYTTLDEIQEKETRGGNPQNPIQEKPGPNHRPRYADLTPSAVSFDPTSSSAASS